MKTIGEILKAAREDRGISIEQAVQETNISREFIEALENESFDKFPAETYLIGFLKNYSGFLDLDPNKAVGLYRNYKLSLEPTPIEELLGSNKNIVVRRYLIGGALAALAALIGIFGIPWLIDVIERTRAENTAAIKIFDDNLISREIHPEFPFWEGVVRLSDVIVLEDTAQTMVEGDAEVGEFRLVIGEAGEKLRIDGMERGEWLMRLGEEINIPNSNGRPTWRIYLKDIGLIGGGAIIEIHELVPTERGMGVFVGSARLPDNEDSGEAETQILREGVTIKQPFVLDIVFQDFCLLRYEVDGKKPIEAYYSESERIRLDVVSGVILWGSNAGAVDAKIGEEELKLGRDGEVFVYAVSWIIDENQGTYDLFTTHLR